MNLNEFETQVRDVIENILNQLQTLSLLTPQQEVEVLAIGASVQTLAEIIEEFIEQQR